MESPILNLSMDVISQITAFLCFDDLNNFLESQHSFLRAKYDAYFWRNTVVSPKSYQDLQSFIKIYGKTGLLDLTQYFGKSLPISWFHNLSHLNLANNNELVDDEKLYQILLNSPKIRYLNLSKCYWLTDFSIKRMINELQNIESIDLSWTNITDCSLDLLSKFKDSLKNINLSACPMLNPPNVSIFLSSCKKLKSIDLSYHSFVDRKFITDLIQANSSIQSIVCNCCDNITRSDAYCASELKVTLITNALLYSYEEKDIKEYLLKFMIQ